MKKDGRNSTIDCLEPLKGAVREDDLIKERSGVRRAYEFYSLNDSTYRVCRGVISLRFVLNVFRIEEREPR